ncbi:MAG: hypothetical protein GX580_16415 [Candidatus Hydrogenedens sp.]|nr:hypothetical protein [Candidatus Hydrogenedentota bacterium]NLF59215.1 hypothetical protein [Candidatus Hydrogenedens sp.]
METFFFLALHLALALALALIFFQRRLLTGHTPVTGEEAAEQGRPESFKGLEQDKDKEQEQEKSLMAIG